VYTLGVVVYASGVVKLARLRMWRERKALTQQQLAGRAGITRVTVARVEAGLEEPYPTTVRKLANALGLEPEDLMDPLP
jgi:transcriptional regulator with XRE-family HTH domain